jgi:hypothetical protein
MGKDFMRDGSRFNDIYLNRGSDLYIPEIPWGSPKTDISLVRDNQMRRQSAQAHQNIRPRWSWSRSTKELESPAFMTGFDIPEYNALLSRIEAEGKEVSQVTLHFCPETVTETGLWMRLRHYGFTRTESRTDHCDGDPVPELCFCGPPVRWSR